MTLDVIELSYPGCRTQIDDWMHDHPTSTIVRVITSGNFWYIFYE